MKACFASEMRGVDKAASEIGGIPSIVLMENAAMACVEELKNDFANLSEKSVAESIRIWQKISYRKHF